MFIERLNTHIRCRSSLTCSYSGADSGFQVRGGGGGGAHLKKLRRAEGGANIFGVFRVKKSRFYAGCAPPPPPPLDPPLVLSTNI